MFVNERTVIRESRLDTALSGRDQREGAAVAEAHDGNFAVGVVPRAQIIDHVRNIAVTLGVDKDDAAGRTVVASFLNSEQMALALDNDAQWLARKRGVSLVVVDSASAVCKDLPRHDRNAALRRILAAAKELARALNVAVVLVNEISHDFSDGARQGAYRPAMEQLYAFCGRTFRVAQHVQGRRSVALMGSSPSEEMRAPLAITSTGVADAGDLVDDNSDRGFDDDSGDDDDAMRDSD